MNPQFRLLLMVVLLLGKVLAASVVLTGCAGRGAGPVADDAGAQVAAGKRIYLEGILPSGQRLRATVQGDLEVEGTQFNCASCHQRSGYGSSEAGGIVPPILGDILYRPSQVRRGPLLRKLYQEIQSKAYWGQLRDPKTRPAYDDATLRRALRTGIAPDGRELDPMMPRYRLSDSEVDDLIAYLKTMVSDPPAGVEDGTLHFATVVMPEAEPSKRRAMLDVMNAYVARKNRFVRQQFERRGHSLYYKNHYYKAYKEWRLHVWELEGPESGWPQQLERFYRERPVYALLSGIGGDWRPVHEFCERFEIPCLFPHTPLPVVTENDVWSVYFSKGLILEAQALGRYLSDAGNTSSTSRVVQLYHDRRWSRAPAEAFREALKESGIQILDRKLTEESATAIRAAAGSPRSDEIYVLWLSDTGIRAFFDAFHDTLPSSVFVSSTLQENRFSGLPASARECLRMTYPLALPGARMADTLHSRAWLRSRGLGQDQERIQLDTYYTLSIVDHVLTHILERFSRAYFLEEIEHEAEQGLYQSVYPRLSLGPGQRYASKGCYVVKLSEGGVEAVSDWLIPE